MGNSCCGERDKEPARPTNWMERAGKTNTVFEDSLDHLSRFQRNNAEEEDETPGGEYEENNIVLVYDKSKIPKFMSSYFKIQNVTHKALNKYFAPSVVCSSPQNHVAECMVILRNSDLLSNYSIKHIKHLGLSEQFKVRPFSFMGNDPTKWAKQLENDLKNFYNNDGLDFIGGFSNARDFNDFVLVFYERPTFARDFDFNLSVEVYYELVSEKDIQELLNEKNSNEDLQFRGCVTRYDVDRDNIISGKTKVLCHFLVFDKRPEDTRRFYVISHLPEEVKKDPEKKLSDFLNREEYLQRMEIAGLITNTGFQDSFLIFTLDEEF